MSFKTKKKMNPWVGIRAPRRMCRNRRLGGQAAIPGGVKDIEKELLGGEVSRWSEGALSNVRSCKRTEN